MVLGHAGALQHQHYGFVFAVWELLESHFFRDVARYAGGCPDCREDIHLPRARKKSDDCNRLRHALVA
jgi:hypothetical protein